ncbi:Brp/Blh family beta-carotene 15,15'-dioxygenase [Amnibacterium endophyticum]|uniref:Probable beta-carotene 15,15'-dioxygenase n=1 Tax=Amnibacterium endophyticum TaxID=2109337 RepID=A0ABW4LDZ7_9MICO
MTAALAPRTRPTLPGTLERGLLAPTTAVFLAVAAGFVVLDAAGVVVPPAVQAVPFAASVLLFGLPHGALDHLVPARLDRRIGVARSIATVVLLYAVLGGATALLWALAPLPAFIVFIGVTWFHWGQGDLWVDRALRGARASRLDGALTVAVRGALPMLVPLVAHPADYLGVVSGTTRLIDPASGGPGSVAPALRVGLAAALLLLVVAHLLVRRRVGGPVRAAAAEIAVLALFFAAVPPVLAVGLYFTFWHAVRHIVRLELLEPGGAEGLARGRLLAPFGRFMRDAWPVTLAAVLLLAGLALVLHDAGLGTYLVLIAALTTPHTVIVTWMDRVGLRARRG